MSILSKIKSKLFGDAVANQLVEVTNTITIQEAEARAKSDGVLAKKIDDLGIYTPGTTGLLVTVPEPAYKRSTTASRRMQQQMLDAQRTQTTSWAYREGNRATRRFNASAYGHKLIREAAIRRTFQQLLGLQHATQAA